MNKIILICFVLIAFNSNSQDTRLLRQPDISATQIVFAYANDLWVVNKSGGSATRLTSFPGIRIKS